MLTAMSEIETTLRDAKSGRFQTGNSGGGRPRGSRNKLAEQFIEDLRACWQKHGAQALERCALEAPSQFARIMVQLLPRDINLTLSIYPAEFAGRFRSALELLGNEPLPKQRRFAAQRACDRSCRLILPTLS